jgi:hypothetical protein
MDYDKGSCHVRRNITVSAVKNPPCLPKHILNLRTVLSIVRTFYLTRFYVLKTNEYLYAPNNEGIIESE